MCSDPSDSCDKNVSAHGWLDCFADAIIAARESVAGHRFLITEFNCGWKGTPADGWSVGGGESTEYAAAFLFRAVNALRAHDISALSWWTFSTIFEEKHEVPTVGTDLGHEFGPFAADAAMQSVRGVPLPIYRAFQLLRDAGDTVLPVATTGTDAGFEQSGPLTVMATKNASDLGLRVFLSNFARLDGNATPERPAANSSRTVQLTVLCPTRSPGAAAATVRTINSTCANPKAVWIDEMQSVPWPSAAQLDKLRVASRVCEDEVRLRWANASPARAAATLEVRLEAFAVAEVSLRC